MARAGRRPHLLLLLLYWLLLTLWSAESRLRCWRRRKHARFERDDLLGLTGRRDLRQCTATNRERACWRLHRDPWNDTQEASDTQDFKPSPNDVGERHLLLFSYVF